MSFNVLKEYNLLKKNSYPAYWSKYEDMSRFLSQVTLHADIGILHLLQSLHAAFMSTCHTRRGSRSTFCVVFARKG